MLLIKKLFHDRNFIFVKKGKTLYFCKGFYIFIYSCTGLSPTHVDATFNVNHINSNQSRTWCRCHALYAQGYLCQGYPTRNSQAAPFAKERPLTL